MAVVNTVDDVLTHPTTAGELGGARLLSSSRVIDIAAADSDLSVFLMGEVPDIAVIESIEFECTDITGGTSFSVGLYDVDGTVIDDNCFADAVDFSSISGLPLGPHGVAIRQLMSAVSIANANKKVYEHAGHVNKTYPGSGETQKKSKYRIGLKATTIGSEAVTGLAIIKYRIVNG